MLVFYLNLLENQQDKNKFEEVYYKYKDLMLYVAFDVLKDTSLAEDAVQSVFLKIVMDFKNFKFDDEQKTKSFIVIATKNAAISMYRKRKHELFLDFEKEIENGKNIIDNLSEMIEAKLVAEEINNLPEKYKDILVLKFFNGCNYEEISKILNISKTTARKRIERARVYLEGRVK